MPDHHDVANLVWRIADLLRGPYTPPQCERVMLPMTVLRRFDCVLAGTKDKVLAEYEKRKDGKAKPDAKLRDFENVPLKEDTDAYFRCGVLPHVPDAWTDRSKDKVGYEINFNRQFYKFTPPRELAKIEAEIEQAEKEFMRLFKEVTK